MAILRGQSRSHSGGQGKVRVYNLVATDIDKKSGLVIEEVSNAEFKALTSELPYLRLPYLQDVVSGLLRVKEGCNLRGKRLLVSDKGMPF